MQNSQHSQCFTPKNTDRSTNWVLSKFRDWAKKKNINTTQEAMAVPLGKTVCKTWWINVCNSTAMGITRNKTNQILRATSEMSGKDRTSFTRSSTGALAQNSINLHLQFYPQSRERFSSRWSRTTSCTASTKSNVTVPAFSFHCLQNCTINITKNSTIMSFDCFKRLHCILPCMLPW